MSEEETTVTRVAGGMILGARSQAKMTTNYNHLSGEYDQTKINPLRKYVDKFTLLKVLGDVRGKSVLDLGCGHGHYTRIVKSQGAAQVVGVDISQAMIADARSQEQQTSLGIEYRVQDVGDLERIGSFDLALAVYLFPYAATRRQLSEMCHSVYRNLKPGGKLVAAVLNPAVTRAELPSYQKYGVTVAAPTGLQDGAAITASLEIPDGSVNISAYYWSQATYERLLEEASFQKIVWHPMEVPKEAIQRYGQNYWQTFQAKSLDIVLECYKPSEAG
jgi:2-polyprenyl-3-methyl-5-hydroxy-6-metoxy-1,4-benzoquinol methylase